MKYAQGESIGDYLRERNVELVNFDPISRGGFTQVPNFILRDGTLSLGAKVSYSMFLHFDWYNQGCFPGQARLAEFMGMSVSRVNEYIKELEAAGLVEIKRQGQGKTNFYRLHYVVQNKGVRKNRKP